MANPSFGFSEEEAEVSKSLAGKELDVIFAEFGANSIEFFVKLKMFIVYLMKRYAASLISEELFYKCYLKVLSSLIEDNQYDPTRSNIKTFIFSLVRNEISKTVYAEEKARSHVNIDDLYDLEDTSSSEEIMVDMLEEVPIEYQKLWSKITFTRIQVCDGCKMKFLKTLSKEIESEESLEEHSIIERLVSLKMSEAYFNHRSVLQFPVLI